MRWKTCSRQFFRIYFALIMEHFRIFYLFGFFDLLEIVFRGGLSVKEIWGCLKFHFLKNYELGLFLVEGRIVTLFSSTGAPKNPKLIKICTNLRSFMKICENWWKLVKICENLRKFVKNCENLRYFAKIWKICESIKQDFNKTTRTSLSLSKKHSYSDPHQQMDH